MADKKTSEEEEAGALTGSELVRIVQNGSSRRATINQIVLLTGGGSEAPSTLSGAQTAIETETLGISVSDGDGTTTLQLTKNIDGLVAVADGNLALTAAEINVYTPAHDLRLHVGFNFRLDAEKGIYIAASGTQGVHMAAESGPLRLSGPQASIDAETLGITLSDNAGNTNSIQMTLYGGNNVIVTADSVNVDSKVGGNINLSAGNGINLSAAAYSHWSFPAGVHLGGDRAVLYATSNIGISAGTQAALNGQNVSIRGFGSYGVGIFADSGPISLTPDNATQAIHLRNRVEADDWPTADPAVSNRLWIDGDVVRRSDGSGDRVIATKGALLQASSTQSIGNTSWTSAQFTSGDGNPALDEDSFYSSGANTRLTMPRDGWYVITSWHTWAGNNTGQRYARLLLNGSASLTQDSRIVSAAGNDPNVVMSIVHKFSAGDYVELQVWQSSGGSLNLAGAILRIAPLP